MFLHYIKEIKNRSFLISLTWVSTFICSYSYKENILFLCVKPSLYYFKDSSFYFISTNLTEIFYTYLDLMYFIANNLTFILLIYHILIFLHLGLTSKEYNKFKSIILISFALWVFYILYINNYFLKLCWDFFISFQNSNNNSLNFFFNNFSFSASLSFSSFSLNSSSFALCSACSLSNCLSISCCLSNSVGVCFLHAIHE